MQLKESAQAAGFREELTPYCLRQGSAAAVDAVAMTSQRNKILGHRRSDVYNRHYIGQGVTVELQSAFMKTAIHVDIMQLFNSMSITKDMRAPVGTIGVDQRGVAAVEDGESVGVDLVERVHRSRFWGTAGKDN
ncbi:hypothetical protein DFH27DRAFT_643344 [Peziza echinospora]|nr:hypothetical protein DFH27DRAFT_643344 [Peziza echinospora]